MYSHRYPIEWSTSRGLCIQFAGELTGVRVQLKPGGVLARFTVLHRACWLFKEALHRKSTNLAAN
jgi:hypothetical protein